MEIFVRTLVFFAVLSISICGQTKNLSNFNQENSKNAAGLTIKYIANEGILIVSGDRQILIDGLHRQYKPEYAFPPPDLLESMEMARPPYNRINLILVSHIHSDHFHPESVGLYLKNNSKSILVSSGQVAGEISKTFGDYEKVKSRIREITPQLNRKVSVDIEGIKLGLLGLKHTNPQHAGIQNLGHLIEINGRKLLHIGDADMTIENFSAFELNKEKIDVAFIPYWYLLSEKGRFFVKEQFNPKHIVAVHISPGEEKTVLAELKKYYLEIIVFTSILEEKSF